MDIAACSRCASTDLRMPGFGDGIIPETDNLGEFACDQCGLRAIPILFDSTQDYEAFARQHRVDGDD